MHDSPPTELNGQYNWTKGAEMTLQTQVGTMVAWGWDANGNYPSKPTGNHTAIYAGTDKNGNMLVTEQNYGGKDAPNGEYRTRPVQKAEVFNEVNSKQKYD